MRRGTIVVAVLLALAIPAKGQNARTLGQRLHEDVTAYESVLTNVGCRNQRADVQRAYDRLSVDVARQMKHFNNKSNAILRDDIKNLMTQVNEGAESCAPQLHKDGSPSNLSAAERLEQELAEFQSTLNAVDRDIVLALEETK